MTTNREAMEAALRQAWDDGHIKVMYYKTGDQPRVLPDLATRLLEALGVDPAGTTEPQSDAAHQVIDMAREDLARLGAEVERLRAERDEAVSLLANHLSESRALAHVPAAHLDVLLSLLGLPPSECLAAAVDRVRELLAAGDGMAECMGGPAKAPVHTCIAAWLAVRGEATDTEEAGR